jgi:hypothetical protein
VFSASSAGSALIVVGSPLLNRLNGPYASQAACWASGAERIVALLYLACLAMVLYRPNACD